MPMLILILYTATVDFLKGEKINDPTLKPDPGFYGRGLGELFKEEFNDAQSTNREEVAYRWFRRTWEERMSAKLAYEGEFCPDVRFHFSFDFINRRKKIRWCLKF